MTYSIDPLVPSGDVNALIADYEAWLHKRASALTGPDKHEDLVQEGRIAVWQATRSFDTERGALPHWLTFKAENKMKEVITEDLWTGRPDRSEGIRERSVTEKGLENRRKISEFTAVYRRQHGRAPSQAAIGRALGMHQGSVSKYMKTLTAVSKNRVSTSSLDELLDAEHGAEFLVSTADLTDSIALAYHRGEIATALDSLTPAQKKYVVLRFWCGFVTAELKQEFGYDPSALWSARPSGAREKLRRALAHLV